MRRRSLVIGGGSLAVIAGAGVAAGLVSMGSSADYAAAAAEARAAVARTPALPEIVRLAMLAPNGHNTQPWRFRLGADRIEVLPDFARRTPVVDPEDHHLFISLGAAAETAAIAAAAHGRPAEVTFEPDGDGRLACRLGSGAAAESPLYATIPRRQSTRAAYDGRPLTGAELDALAAAAAQPGISLALVTDPAAMRAVADLVILGNTQQMGDPAFMQELTRWLRFNPREALATRDGLYAGSSGNPNLPSWVARPVLRVVFRAEAENAKYAANIASSAGIAVFFADADDRDHWTRVGRAFQRFALQATALDIRTAHLNQPVEVPSLRGDLAGAVGAAGAHPYLVVRFGRGPTLPFSLRRPVADVLA